MDEKIELTPHEKVELNNFLKKYEREVGTGGRREMFTKNATDELLYLRNANEQRKAEGLEEIKSSERTMSLKSGVIKSVYRAKQEQEMSNEANRSNAAMYRETVRDW